MSARGLLLLALAFVELIGCGGQPCTDIPCSDHLLIQTELNAERIEVSDGDDVRTCMKGDIACWKSDNGDHVARFPSFAPKQVSIRVLDASSRVLAESNERPDYEADHNGGKCPPLCLFARVIVD